MNRTLRYTLMALLWVAVAAYVLAAGLSARRRRAAQTVARVEIEVVDSSSMGHLVSTARVREWLAQSRIPTVGAEVRAVDLTGIEALIARNGFVDRAAAYVTYDGALHISISQRRPLVRLLLDGYDSYVTEEGFAFAAPRASSLYVPVVTGPYRPPFPASYAGRVREWVDERQAEVRERIAAIEREKYPLYRRERDNDRRLAELRRERVRRAWWRLESAESFDRRVTELREEKARRRRSCRYEARLIQQEFDRLAERQEAARREEKKLEKSYQDFMKLLTFVASVEEDDFWRSEVVQIVARTTPSGALEVDLVPRSGNHLVLFGRLEDEERKFDKLMRFYRSGLSGLGWGEFRTVDLRYEGQVVCKR